MIRNQQSKRSRKQLGLLMVLLSFWCMIFAAAWADGTASLQESEWSWEADQAATFTGVFSFDGPDVTEATLTLTVETNLPENHGSVVFTEVNGETIKIRKRSDTMTADLLGNGAENTIKGEWYLPKNVNGLNRAVIRLQVKDGDGKVLAAADLKTGEEGEEESAAASLLSRFWQIEMLLLAVFILLWCVAILRYLVLRRKRA